MITKKYKHFLGNKSSKLFVGSESGLRTDSKLNLESNLILQQLAHLNLQGFCVKFQIIQVSRKTAAFCKFSRQGHPSYQQLALTLVKYCDT